jgi:hypothetical protein
MSITLSAAAVKKAIVYYYLLSYCDPQNIGELYEKLTSFRKAQVAGLEINEDLYFQAVLPEVCQRIVGFHCDTRNPDESMVNALRETAAKAHQSPQDAETFQQQMRIIQSLPERALPDNRLHRRKGCAFCLQPCSYGFFTLVSEPDFKVLKQMLDAELQRDRATQSAIRPIWYFTSAHMAKVMHFEEEFSISKQYLGNLSYCLLMLATAKSRIALREEKLQIYQQINQHYISNL